MQENVFVSSARIDIIRGRVETSSEPNSGAFDRLKAFVDERLEGMISVPKSWSIPAYSTAPEKYLAATAGFAEDGMTAYGCALLFRLKGESEYLERCTRIINGWVDGFRSYSKRGDSRPAFSALFLPMLFAVDLLRGVDSFTSRDLSRFEGFLTDTVIPIADVGSKDYRGCWGTALKIACAAFLRDGTLFEYSIRRWRGLLDSMLGLDGALKREVTRGGGRLGILYTNRCLAAMCIGASVAGIHGSDLFYYRTADGKTIRDAVSTAARWSAYPATFQYWKKDLDGLQGREETGYLELIPASWYDAPIRELLDTHRPFEDEFGLPFVTFTHGD